MPALGAQARNDIWWLVAVNYVYFGCYGFGGGGKAYFGGGGTETQKLQAIVRLPRYSSTPSRLSSLDTDCLLLSNQAELESNLAAIFPMQISLISLETSLAAIVSKLNPTLCSGFNYNDCPTANGCYGSYVEGFLRQSTVACPPWWLPVLLMQLVQQAPIVQTQLPSPAWSSSLNIIRF